MRRINLTIIFIGFVLLLYGQQKYFSRRYDLLKGPDISGSILEKDNGYVILGSLYDTNSTDLKIGILYIDSTGNEILGKYYGKSKCDYSGGYPGAFIKTFDSGYALSSGLGDSTGKDYVLLIRFNDSFDTLWTKQYLNLTGSIFESSYNGKQTNDSGFVLIGATGANGNDILLIKTDSLGTLQWYKQYGGPGIEYGFTVDVCRDGGYILGGYRTCGFKCRDNYIIKTDSLGNQQWDTIFGGTYEDGPAHVLQLADEGYIVGTRLTDSQPTSSTFYSRLNILRLDSSWNTVWDKTYGPIRFGTNPWNINLDKDSNLVVTGNTSDINEHIMGLIAKISLNGDSLWYREYDIGKEQSSQNYLRHTVPTSDGGYISAGFVIPVPPDTGTQDMWVLKLDSCGCDYLGCDSACQGLVGVEEFQVSDFGFQVYPNPTEGKFTIQILNNTEAEKPYQINIYDILGRNITHTCTELCRSIKTRASQIEVDISKHPAGLYFIQVRSENTLYDARIVKQ